MYYNFLFYFQFSCKWNFQKYDRYIYSFFFFVHRIEFIDFNVISDFIFFFRAQKLFHRTSVQSGCQVANVKKLRYNFLMTKTKRNKKKYQTKWEKNTKYGINFFVFIYPIVRFSFRSSILSFLSIYV